MEEEAAGELEAQGRLVGCAVEGPRALHCAVSVGTVSGSNSEPEDRLIGQQQWQVIHERRAAGQAIAAIARELDLDRKTVRTCLQQAAWTPYRREANESTLLDAERAWLVERAPQVHHSARILYQELSARGWAGSYETVKLAVRPLRAEARVAALTQRRFETGPGEQAQVDWGQITVRIAGVATSIHVFVMTLGYSRRGYAEGFLHERMPNLLAAHENAFAHFGGRCESLLYDRMRTVVLGSTIDGSGNRRPKFNTTFDAFAHYWGFTPRLCQPYRAQTKGKVESGVKYVKRNFAPGRTFHDLDDFNAQLAAWQAEIADRRLHGTTHQLPIERFATEAPMLIPTASQPSFLAAMVRDRVVADDWLITLGGHRYSVPFALIGRTVQVVREGEQWVVRHQGQVVAQHAVLTGTAQWSVEPGHGPGAVLRNARKRYAEPVAAADDVIERSVVAGRDVEVRDLAVYEHLLQVAIAHDVREAA
jgi:transposase